MISLFKKNKKKAVLLLASVFSFLTINFGYAENNNGNNGEEVEVTIPSLTHFESIREFLAGLINLLIQVGLVLVPLMIVIGGLYYMFGGANQESIEKGKKVIKWSVIALFLVVAARAILQLIFYLFS